VNICTSFHLPSRLYNMIDSKSVQIVMTTPFFSGRAPCGCNCIDRRLVLVPLMIPSISSCRRRARHALGRYLPGPADAFFSVLKEALVLCRSVSCWRNVVAFHQPMPPQRAWKWPWTVARGCTYLTHQYQGAHDRSSNTMPCDKYTKFCLCLREV